jgi:hypothetical protein
VPDLSHTIAYRAVAGAVRNALHGHPIWTVPQDFARSVAKRAAGTLMAHAGPSLLASARRSDQRQRLLLMTAGSAGGAPMRRLLAHLHSQLTIAVTIAHKAKDEEQCWALMTAARIIKREIQRDAATKAPPQIHEKV